MHTTHYKIETVQYARKNGRIIILLVTRMQAVDWNRELFGATKAMQFHCRGMHEVSQHGSNLNLID